MYTVVLHSFSVPSSKCKVCVYTYYIHVPGYKVQIITTRVLRFKPVNNVNTSTGTRSVKMKCTITITVTYEGN